MAAIGGVTCDIIRTDGGRPPATLREETHSFRMPGISGYGTLLLGAANGEFQITAIRFNTGAAVATWEAALQALQGSVVSIVDNLGKTHTHCLLERVGNAAITAAYNPDGTTHRGEILIEGLKVG